MICKIKIHDLKPQSPNGILFKYPLALFVAFVHLSENSSGCSQEGNLFLEIFTYLMIKVRITVSYYEAGCYNYTRCLGSIGEFGVVLQQTPVIIFAYKDDPASALRFVRKFANFLRTVITYSLKIKMVEKIIKKQKNCFV